MKKRLIILSDLWGKEKAQWVDYYITQLQDDFDVVFYDCCELSDIDISNYNQEALHEQFVADGIDRAVKKLIAVEKEPSIIVAFSIGGTIAWRFALESTHKHLLYCISSTRLRYETKRPESSIHLIYGEKDIYRPGLKWLDKMNLTYEILENKKHELYQESSFALNFCSTIKALL